jgi:mannose-6-phosphate isomerase-like protein (cupin superfamily)
MKAVKRSDAIDFSNGPTCTGHDYLFDDKALNIAIVKVEGRYPEKGYAYNDVCKEVGFVLKGKGTLAVEGHEVVSLMAGDAVMIQPGEKYFWQGESLAMLMPCSPAFYPEQHMHIAD